MTDDKMTLQARKMSWATRVITRQARTEKSVLVRACGRCCLYTSRHVHGSCYFLDAKLPEKTEKCARPPMESGLRWTWQQLRHRSAQVSLCWSVRYSGVVEVVTDLAILCLAIHESAILAIHWSQNEELHQVGLSVQVEDGDDEKYVFQLRLNHSECCWTARSNVFLCLLRKFIGMWGTPLPCFRWMLTSAFADDL